MTNNGFYPITCWCGVHGKFIRHPDGTLAVERLQEMKDSGINNILAFYDVRTNLEVLKACEDLGLVVTVGDERIDRALHDAEHRDELLHAVADDYKDCPALMNYHIVDEPNSSVFPMLADMRATLAKYDTKHEAYINLFPNYASPEQLGNPTYYDHVEQFINDVKPEIISYDHYHFIKGAPIEKVDFKDEREKQIYEAAFSGGHGDYELVDRAGFFNNIEDVRDLSLKYDIPFMVIILVVEHGPYRNLTEGELRWEVWQSLAYGSQRLSYFTYWTPGVDGVDGEDFWHWQNGMITKDGQKTEHYEIISRINRELSGVGGELIGRKSIGVFHVGEIPDERVTAWNGAFADVKDIKASKATVGFFEGGYILVTNRDYKNETDVNIYTDSTLEIFEPDGGEWISVEAASGIYTLTLDAGDAILTRTVKKIF